MINKGNELVYFSIYKESSALCVSLFKGFKMARIKTPNKVQKIAMLVNISNSPKCWEYCPNVPANLFPRPDAAKKAPIMKEAYFTGANFVIKESATGEAQSSPMV